MTAPRRTRTRRAQVHLPALDPHEALLLANIFERAARAIWRAHGDAMADHLACTDPDRMLDYHSPDDIVTAEPNGADDDF